MKGIILAGGSGSRLYPITLTVCKQLLPVFDKPMIYYPLSVLMLAGIRDILLIAKPEDIPRFQRLFGDGSFLNISITYAEQEKPNGLAEAFIIGESFIKNDSVALILGDNIFYGPDLSSLLPSCFSNQGGLIFGYRVQDPERYGVVEFDIDGRVVGIEEKPQKPKSSYAVPGLYFYDSSVVDIAKNLIPSKRGELEITDVNTCYLQKKNLHVKLLGRGYAWLDMGTYDALQKASIFVQTIQERQGVKIACIEEIAYRMGFITQKELIFLKKRYGNSEYGEYLLSVAETAF